MKKNMFLLLTVSYMFTMTSCQKEKIMSLKVDYRAEKQYTYSIAYTSQGLFTQDDSTTTMNTVLNSRLTGKATAGDKLHLTVENLQITSDMLTDEEKEKVTEKLSKAEYNLTLQEGSPTIDTSAEMPSGSFPEWDLYRQFLRLLPELPSANAEPGFTWERTATLPLATVHGTIPCEIYRSYTFDSLSLENATGYISWQFRYSTDKSVIDSTNFMKQIPVAGNGTGSAQIDIKKHIISQADMQFETPLAKIGEVSVNWREQAVLKFIE